MTQAVSRRLSLPKPEFEPNPVNVRFVEETLPLVTGFPPSTPVFPWQYHSNNNPHSASPTCYSYKKDKLAKPGRLSESDQCPFSSGEALNTQLVTFHPDSAWKRSSETCMKLTSVECTIENS
jgi:hypothetical protein